VLLQGSLDESTLLSQAWPPLPLGIPAFPISSSVFLTHQKFVRKCNGKQVKMPYVTVKRPRQSGYCSSCQITEQRRKLLLRALWTYQSVYVYRLRVSDKHQCCCTVKPKVQRSISYAVKFGIYTCQQLKLLSMLPLVPSSLDLHA